MIRAIDYWCNLFTPEATRRLKEWPEMVYAFEYFGRPQNVARGFTPAEFVEMMDEAGIEKALIPSSKMRKYRGEPGFYVSVEEVAEVVQQFPDRFAGLAGVDPFARMEGVREVERAVKEHGFVGAWYHPYGFGISLSHKLVYPFYAKCVELDVPIVVQTGHSAEMMPSEMGRPLLLDEVALDFPELKIVAGHMGWPWVEELIALAWKHPNLYIGTTAHSPKYWDPSMVRFINSRGRNKVLFGSDFPVLYHKETRDQIEALGLREEAKQKLLRDNAVKVFRL